MKVITFVTLFTFFFSCNSHENHIKKTDEAQPQSKPSSTPSCYRYAAEADTITLKLINTGKSVTGTLVYSLKEKDKNTGTIQGEMRNDILLADYTFMSEGMKSVRQVAFKLEGNNFIEGYGDSYEQNEKTVFRNPDALTFSPTVRLAEIACQ